jgi:hypothetical protein
MRAVKEAVTMTESIGPHDARRALANYDRIHSEVIKLTVPALIFPVMGAVFAAFFFIEAFAGAGGRHVAESLSWLCYLSFLGGYLYRRRREARRVKPHGDLLSPQARRGALGFALSLLILLLIGLAIVNRYGPPYLTAGYGLALGAYTAIGGLLLRRRWVDGQDNGRDTRRT